jgi:proteasome lid subunit RPN8/RPN11
VGLVTHAALDYAVEVRWNGELVGSEPASLGVLREDALFRGILEGRIENNGQLPSFAVAPIWGGPEQRCVTGLTLSLDGAPAGRYSSEALASQAHSYLAALREREPQRLGEAELVWELVAHPAGPELARAASVTRAALPFEPCALPHLPRGSFAVEISPDLLERMRDAVVREPTVEYAALLTGRLLRDPERCAGALRIDDAVELHAGAGGRSRIHFALGADSFLDAARTVRARGATIGGWAHSHPPCEACPANPTCRTSTVFFSAPDIEVHSAAFPAGYMVGLVAGKLADQPATRPGFRLYGWHEGTVRERDWSAPPDATQHQEN